MFNVGEIVPFLRVLIAHLDNVQLQTHTRGDSQPSITPNQGFRHPFSTQKA